MKTLKLGLLTLMSIAMFSCKGEKKDATTTEEYKKEGVENTKETTEEEDVTKTLEITLDPKSDSEVSGKVVFTESEGMVNMVATLTGLSEGEHAIHIHEKADCSSADGKSTGGHWNPTLQPHGAWGAKEGFHRGDIGNFKADAQGNGNITFATNEWCIGCDDEKKNIVGKAIIVHQGEDDFKSQPSGAAGSRVSCGGIIQ
ncbi:superoxide dismutase family protein [Aquimarina sp. MMG016]|uniref:superoxide dismutase family protein n=1 Tax=Aquimarina sp. MMG016 TaxID=2822690 RepID=UPI001B3A4E5C|nr:superoxide dismutase family protein [Aquimarina sp. MMG016]MBQ4822377.1 superoxide dismutase family protein [Aquimarina sp. MMG016]